MAALQTHQSRVAGTWPASRAFFVCFVLLLAAGCITVLNPKGCIIPACRLLQAHFSWPENSASDGGRAERERWIALGISTGFSRKVSFVFVPPE